MYGHLCTHPTNMAPAKDPFEKNIDLPGTLPSAFLLLVVVVALCR